MCWGNNRYGEVGLGLVSGRCEPVTLPGVSDVVQLAAGNRYTCAVTRDGSVQCWGVHPGRARAERTTVPSRIPLEGVVELATTSGHACARTTSAAVWCWGSNTYGELGRVREPSSASPRRVPIAPAIAITVTDERSCAVLEDGSVTCWGNLHALARDPDDGSDRWRRPPTALGEAPPLRTARLVGDTLCGIDSSGSVHCWLVDPELGFARAQVLDLPPVDGWLGGTERVACASAATCEDGRCARPAVCFRASTQEVQGIRADVSQALSVPVTHDLWSLALARRDRRGSANLTGCGIEASGAVVCWDTAGDELSSPDLTNLDAADAPEDASGRCGGVDRDADGAPDDVDRCPGQAEVYNGVDDDDGCPDEPASLVEVDEVAGVIRLREKVQFELDKASIREASYPMLRHLAATLEGYGRFARIEVQGHSAPVVEHYGRSLSQARAQSVRQFLVKHGIVPELLVVKDYGETRPIAPNDTRANKRKNQRVELVILEYNAEG